MRQFTLSLLLLPLCAFAQEIEVTGQFVVAPISSEKCEALAVTTPTDGLPANSKLLEMITPFMSENNTPSDIENIKMEPCNEFAVMYDIGGKKQNVLRHGLNIVMDKNNNRRKVVLR